MAPLLLAFFTIFLSALFLLAIKRRPRPSHRLPLPPGPKGWPLLGFLPSLGPDPHKIFHRLSKTYGPLLHLRLGVVHVVIPSSAAITGKLLRNNDLKFINRPNNSGAEHIAYNYQDIGFLPYGPRWRMQRKLCAQHLFSSKALDDFQDLRRQELTALVRRLAVQSSKDPPEVAAMDISREMAACVGNSLSLLLFGRRAFNDDDGRPEVEGLRHMVMELMALTGSFCLADFLPGLRWLDPQGLIARMKKLNRKFDKLLDVFIAEHRATLAEAHSMDRDDDGRPRARDLLTVMLRLQEDVDGEGGKLSDTEIKALLLALYAAGSDSSSILADWALAELIRNPALLARAQAEIDSVVGRDRLVTESDLPNLPLIHAIVKETLRLHPPAPLSLPRVAVEDCEAEGYLIPKGTTLLLNIWAIGRDPTVWPDEPLAFRPDRFLPGGEQEGVDPKGGHLGLLPFGTGRRMCVGMNLGLRMLEFMTAVMVHSFEWSLPHGQRAENLNMEEGANGLSLPRSVPLVARPLPRLAPEAYLPFGLKLNDH